jgi:hypothetical protein
MKEHFIFFEDEMVRAILEGRKTQTRRVVKPQPFLMDSGVWYQSETPGDRNNKTGLHYANENHMRRGLPSDFCPYGQPSDLWVRETWATMCRVADPTCECSDYEDVSRNHYFEYKADSGNPLPGDWPEEERHDSDCPKWKSSMFMPRIASRIQLKIVNVRVERVQEISQADAKAEGVKPWWLASDGWRETKTGGSFSIENCPEEKRDYRKGFLLFWDSLNTKRGFGWEINPWVWVIDFKRIVA